MPLSHTPDSEHILKTVMCSKNKHCMKLFICIKRITSGMRMPSSPDLFNRYSFLNWNFKTEILANFEFLGVSNLSTNCS